MIATREMQFYDNTTPSPRRQQQMQWQQMQHMQAVNEAMRRGQPLPPPPAPVFAPQTAMVPFGGHGGASPGAPQPPPATSLLLDVFVRYAYRGHHGRSWNPLPRLNIPQERRLRLLVDASRTASQIRDEVLARRDIVPDNYGYLGCDMKSQTGFELSDKDVVREVRRVGGSGGSIRGGHTLTPLPPSRSLPAVNTASSRSTTERTRARAITKRTITSAE